MTDTRQDRDTREKAGGAIASGAARAPHARSLIHSDSVVLQPLGIDEVRVEGGYWRDVQDLNRLHIIRHCLTWIERTGWTTNFDLAAAGRGLPERRQGPVFSDATVYKVLEAAAWELGRRADPALESDFVALSSRVIAAQEPDGYVGTSFGHPGQPARYSDLEWGHELYCVGHLVQAGIARARATSQADPFFVAALRAADQVCEVFGARGLEKVGGHPEIEVALVELARLTGARRYLAQARLFVERRGRGSLGQISFGPDYFQDATPIREQTALVGHAVRALYLAAGALDVAVEDSDRGLLDALVAQMEHTDARRTYLTGGVGSRHEGESFGDDDELPPDRAYSETCAGVGSMMVHHRLTLATGRVGYADAVERALYNVVLTSPAEDGEAFFYTNTLQKRVAGTPTSADAVSLRASSSLRAAWFGVSCCPPNVARTLAALASYTATTSERGLQILQYVDGVYATELPDAGPVEVRVHTDYPSVGKVEVVVTKAPESPWELVLRVPSWAAGANVMVDGVRTSATPPSFVAAAPRVGTRIELSLPVGPRWTVAAPRVDAVRGCVAVECGPLVMCVESVDIPAGRELDDLRVVPERGFRTRDGVTSIPVVWRRGAGRSPLYRGVDAASAGGSRAAVAADDVDWVPLTPYQHWANRGPSTMRVWIPVYGSDV